MYKYGDVRMNSDFNIDISRSTPLYLQVKQNILRLIDREELKDGDRLPSEIDLARICNLSRGTVRMALAELAQEGLISRSPKRGSFLTLKKAILSTRIGVISPLFPIRSNFFPDFFQTELVSGIREGALRKGATLLFLPNLQDKSSVNQFFCSNNLDVVLFLIPDKDDIPLIYEIEKVKIPCLSVSAAVGNNFNYVATDNFKGSMLAAEHLISLGHRRIGLVVTSLGFDSRERYNGYCQALEEHGIPFDERIVRVIDEADNTSWQKAARKAAAEILREDGVTAIFAPGLSLAIGVKEAIEEVGLSIPTDISLVAFDDFYLASHMSPKLTTVSRSIWELGRTGLEKAIELVKGEIKPPVNVILETKLIVRESSVNPMKVCNSISMNYVKE